jgi:hypothetical protein
MCVPNASFASIENRSPVVNPDLQTKPDPQNRRLLSLIMFGILVWGAVLAVGTYHSPEMQANALRTLVVYAFVVAFVGFWAILLKMRDSRDS